MTTSIKTEPTYTSIEVNNVEKLRLTDSGEVNLAGTGRRITGDFSNATIANRVVFQTSTVNGVTGLVVAPNGTGVSSGCALHSDSNMANGSIANIAINPGGIGEMRINSTIIGSGTYLPITFFTVSTERLRIDTSGNVLVKSAAGLGYGTGAGGTVTQATSKTTAVTLNKPCGQITMNNAALAAGATVGFNVNNSVFSVSDTVIVTPSANGNYRVVIQSSNAGIFTISVTNTTGGSLSEALVLNFAIIKGATS